MSQIIEYGSVCSGIEAATLAWKPLGMRATWFAEIEAFPSAVLAHHYPNTPNLGDMTKLGAQVLAGKITAPDVLVGGTPCQAFSVAGMREGLTDPRGALTIKYVELADAVDYVRAGQRKPPCVIVWENVPGVLSDKGNAFGCFLGALAGEDCELQPSGKKWPDAGCVYGPKRTIAWRILDAQYFGLAQRRRRVFVVASARDDFDPTKVLFEREGVRRDTAPRRGEGQDVTGTITGGARKNGGYSADDIPLTAPALRAQAQCSHRADSEAFIVAGTLSANGKAAGSATQQDAESGLLVVHGTQDPDVRVDQAHTLGRNNGMENAVLAFSCKDHGADAGEIAPTLRAMNHSGSHANAGGQVAVCITGDITHALKADGFDGSEDGTGRGQPIVVCREVAQTLTSNYGKQVDNTNSALGPNIVAAFAENSRSELRYEDGDGGIAGALGCGGGKPGQGMPSAQVGTSVRRLTPRECERLQGMPDDYTLIPYGRAIRPEKLDSDFAKYLMRGGRLSFEECLRAASDGPRYKAIGNSKAVPCVRWIGRRILKQLCQVD